MKATDRPVVVGRWIDGPPARIEAHAKAVELENDGVAVARSLYELADGTYTVSQIAALANTEPGECLEFFSILEDAGACFDACCTSMFGHAVSALPDPLRPNLSDEGAWRVTKLEPDPDGQTIELNTPLDPVDVARHSEREFSGLGLARDDLSRILLSSYGVTRRVGSQTRRPVPSGGAMYPLQHDLFALNVADLERAHWRMGKHRNTLIRMSDLSMPDLAEALFEQWENAAVVHVIGFDLSRSSQKYGGRAYRMALLEAGHAAQNAMRTATQLNIGSWEIAGYRDAPLTALCGLSGITAGVATVVLYGHYENKV